MFLDTSKRIEKDKVFIEDEIKPSVDYIKDFKNKNNRLPSSTEFYNWKKEFYGEYSTEFDKYFNSFAVDEVRISYIRRNEDILIDDQRKFKAADWAKDFAIAVWYDDRTSYYFSWTDSYDSNNYTCLLYTSP